MSSSSVTSDTYRCIQIDNQQKQQKKQINQQHRRRGFLASEEGLKNLEASMRQNSYSQESLAEAAAVSVDQVKKLLNPHWGRGIEKDAIRKIAHVLNLLPTDIVVSTDWYKAPKVTKSEQSIIMMPCTEEVVFPCPYRGLSAFREEEAPFFFGREEFTKKLIAFVQKKPLVAVIGRSGSGKSSVVFAGLIPQLRQEGNYVITHFSPKNRPLYKLAEALMPLLKTQMTVAERLQETRDLADAFRQHTDVLQDVIETIVEKNPGTRLVLVADQFEELYTLCQVDEERRQFLNQLLKAVQVASQKRSPDFTLVITLRDDFLGQALSYRPFVDALQHCDLKLGPMNCQELQNAIVKPAEKLGVKFQDGLSKIILDAVSGEPGNLPLLEFAMKLLWEKQSAGKLTHTAYEEIGGVEQALAKHAEDVYEKLNEDKQKRIERIFTQLVRPGEGTEDTRRLATRADVGEDNWQLITTYLANQDARLVVTGWDEATNEATVEVVHEALIRGWERLRLWMDANREFRTWQERLRASIRQWEANGKDEGALLRGVPLFEAQEWLQKRSNELTKEEQNFIWASVVLRDREKQERERLQLGQIEALGYYSQELFSRGQELDALILNLQVGQQLTRQKVGSEIRSRVVAQLRQMLYKVRERNRLQGHKDWVNSVSFSPDGKTIASGSDDKTIILWSSDGHLLHTLTGHGSRVNKVVFSPDGKTIASGSQDTTLKFWSLDGHLLHTLTGHKDDIWGISFSPDGKTIATASDDQTVKLWSLDGQLLYTFIGHQGWVRGVCFSPDGKTIATASRDKTIKLWSLDGQLLYTLTGHENWVDSLSFSPDGKTIATASRDKTIKLWSVEGQELRTITGHEDWVRSVCFSPDGKTIATVSADKTVKLWSLDGQLLDTLIGHSDWVNSVCFSPDSKTIASASMDCTIKLWNCDIQLLQTLTGHKDEVLSVSFSPNGKKIASASADQTVKLWSMDGQLLQTLTGHNGLVRKVAFNPNGKIVASASEDKTVKLWSIDGQLLQTLTGHNDLINSVAFSPDGKTIATASRDHTVKLWSIDGQLLQTLNAHKDWVKCVCFSPDGNTIVTSSKDHTVKLWMLDGKLLHTLRGHNDWVRCVVFSPDGKTIASASDDKTVKLWCMDGHLLYTFQGHNDEVWSVSFSPDGKTIASASDDKTVKLWSINGQELQTFTGHKDWVKSVSFSPDGKTIATASKDKSVILWKLDLDRWMMLSNLDLDQLLLRTCDWVCDYLKTNPNISESDRHLCYQSFYPF